MVVASWSRRAEKDQEAAPKGPGSESRYEDDCVRMTKVYNDSKFPNYVIIEDKATGQRVIVASFGGHGLAMCPLPPLPAEGK
jgi:hypothetical protein